MLVIRQRIMKWNEFLHSLCNPLWAWFWLIFLRIGKMLNWFLHRALAKTNIRELNFFALTTSHVAVCHWSYQTWNLSKILHRRIFGLKTLHHQFHLISTVLVGKKHKKWVKMKKFTPLAKILHCRRHWRHGQIPPLIKSRFDLFLFTRNHASLVGHVFFHNLS